MTKIASRGGSCLKLLHQSAPFSRSLQIFMTHCQLPFRQKVLLQDMYTWQAKLDWDNPLPQSFLDRWNGLADELDKTQPHSFAALHWTTNYWSLYLLSPLLLWRLRESVCCRCLPTRNMVDRINHSSCVWQDPAGTHQANHDSSLGAHGNYSWNSLPSICLNTATFATWITRHAVKWLSMCFRMATIAAVKTSGVHGQLSTEDLFSSCHRPLCGVVWKSSRPSFTGCVSISSCQWRSVVAWAWLAFSPSKWLANVGYWESSLARSEFRPKQEKCSLWNEARDRHSWCWPYPAENPILDYLLSRVSSLSQVLRITRSRWVQR